MCYHIGVILIEGVGVIILHRFIALARGDVAISTMTARIVIILALVVVSAVSVSTIAHFIYLSFIW
jgi:hypothetical protein